MKVPKAKFWNAGLENGLRRFPVAFAVAVAGFFAVVARPHSSMTDSTQALLLLVPLALVWNAAWTLWGERRGLGRGPLHWTGLAALAALALWAWLGWLRRIPDGNLHDVLRYGLTLGAGWLLAVSAGGGKPGEWRTDAWRLGLATAVAAGFAAAAFAGLVTAAEWLLGVGHWGYAIDIAVAATLCGVAPLTVWAWLPAPDAEAAHLPKWAEATVRWVLLPLVGLYGTVLVAYLGGIALRREWPDGMVALPILAFCLAGWAAWAAVRPENGAPNRSWERTFCRAFPVAAAALAFVLLAALDVRIRPYGVTIDRALGLWAAAWLVAAGSWTALRRRTGTRAVALSAAAAMLAAAWGGPLSAGGLAWRSQWNRYWSAMASAPTAPPDSREALRTEMERAHYLPRTFGVERCRRHFRAAAAARGYADLPPYVLDPGDFANFRLGADADARTAPPPECAVLCAALHADAAGWERAWILGPASSQWRFAAWARRDLPTSVSFRHEGLPFDFAADVGPRLRHGPPLAEAEWTAFRQALLERAQKDGAVNAQDGLREAPLPPEEMTFEFGYGGKRYAALVGWMVFKENEPAGFHLRALMEKAADADAKGGAR